MLLVMLFLQTLPMLLLISVKHLLQRQRSTLNFENWATSYMINPFVKYKGLEFFGTIELASGGDKTGTDDKRNVNQYAWRFSLSIWRNMKILYRR